MKIGIIGGGIMGEVIISALTKKHVCDPVDILVSDRNEEKVHYLEGEYGIHGEPDNKVLVEHSDIVIFAVKPQFCEVVFDEIKESIHDNLLVISIMAGIPIEKMQNALGTENIIRTMPNTPAKIGKGMTIWFPTDAVNDEQKSYTRKILQSFGGEIEVNNEDLIDAGTAVTGSGPAYVFYLAEHIMQAAKDLGFADEDASKMVKQLFLGAAHLMDESEESPAVLRENVTSKGGTTAAALGVMDENVMNEIINKALKAAYNRAKELSE